LGLDFDFFSPYFRIFSFGRKIMIENTLNFPLSFDGIDLNLSGAFILTNSAYKFAFSFFQPEQHNFEGFSSVSFNWGFSDFSFNSSFLFYLAEFKAFEICSAFFIFKLLPKKTVWRFLFWCDL